MSENPFTDGQQFSAARLNSMYNAHQNEGVLNGLDASASANAFDVDVASGELFLNDDVVSVGSATVSLSTSDPEDRIDLLSVDSTGTVNITQGNPAATAGQPVAPDIPTDEILISLVYVRGGSSEILTGDIFNDYKVIITTIPNALLDSIDHSFLNNIQTDDHHVKSTTVNTSGVSDIGRSLDTTYVNDTGTAITLNVTLNDGSDASTINSARMFVDDVEVDSASADNSFGGMSTIVPDGSTYKVTEVLDASVRTWVEQELTVS